MNELNYITIQELYDWAVKNGVEDYMLLIQYRDGGGEYYGSDSQVLGIINDKEKTVTV